MKKAIMYSAGNIGRGFAGALLSQSGYEVAFIDVAQPLVQKINEAGCYTVGQSRTTAFRIRSLRTYAP